MKGWIYLLVRISDSFRISRFGFLIFGSAINFELGEKMSRHRITVVLSQAQRKHPVKRALEEAIVAALIMEPGLEVSVIPHLYDLGPDHTGRLFLGSVRGDMVLLSWLFPRAAFWVMDRDGIKGKWGETQLKPVSADD